MRKAAEKTVIGRHSSQWRRNCIGDASYSRLASDKGWSSVQVLTRQFLGLSDTREEFCMRIASKCVARWMTVAALLCAPVIFGQEVGAPPTPPKPKMVEITPTNIQAHVGDKIKFTAVAKDAT